jgi:hypothetical protein
MKVGLAFVAGLFSVIASAQAADLAIDEFYGRWVVEGIAKIVIGNIR